MDDVELLANDELNYFSIDIGISFGYNSFHIKRGNILEGNSVRLQIKGGIGHLVVVHAHTYLGLQVRDKLQKETLAL